MKDFNNFCEIRLWILTGQVSRSLSGLTSENVRTFKDLTTAFTRLLWNSWNMMMMQPSGKCISRFIYISNLCNVALWGLSRSAELIQVTNTVSPIDRYILNICRYTKPTPFLFLSRRGASTDLQHDIVKSSCDLDLRPDFKLDLARSPCVLYMLPTDLTQKTRCCQRFHLPWFFF